MNRLKTFVLLAGLTALAVGMGWLIGGVNGMFVAFGVAALMNLAGFWWSDRLVLAMYRAQEVDAEHAPGLHALVADVAAKAGVPMPRVYIIPEDSPNAFATGRSPARSAVAVTEGLLRILNRDELKAVIAHEAAHIAHRDTLIGVLSATLAGGISMLANMLLWTTTFGGRSEDEDSSPLSGVLGLVAILVAPFAAMLVQMAVSRSREYMADEAAARIMGDGRPLAGALAKLARGAEIIPHSQRTEPATAHLFIVNPLSGGGLTALFSTHPPMEERIRRMLEWRPKDLYTRVPVTA